MLSNTPIMILHRHFFLPAVGSLLVYGFLFAAGTTIAADVSGDWILASKYLGDTSYARISLKVDEEKLTGNMNVVRTCGFHDHQEPDVTSLQGSIIIVSQ